MIDIIIRWHILQRMNVAKTLTLRLPSGIYERASQLAAARGQSLNRLFQDGFQLLDAQDRDQRLFDDFAAIGESLDDRSEVESSVRCALGM